MNYLLLKQLIQDHINKPVNTGVNSESAFICDKLRSHGENALATEYWHLTCNMSKHDWPLEILELHNQLPKHNIPFWGTYGT